MKWRGGNQEEGARRGGRRPSGGGWLLGGLCLAWAVLAGVTACSLGGGDGGEETLVSWETERRLAPPAVWAEHGPWVGSEACGECHEEHLASLEVGPHRSLLVDDQGFGCEACHGPGGVHRGRPELAGAIDVFGRLSAAEVVARCARCHFESLRQDSGVAAHVEGRGRSCLACHAVHAAGAVAAGAATGTEACASCHAEAVAVHLRSRHGALISGDDAVGCSACHGSAEEHLRRGGGKETISVPEGAELEGLCVSCHRKRGDLRRWKSSVHHGAGMGCLDCHEVLGSTVTSGPERETALCGRCHQAETAEFLLPNHHPIPEGAMTCTSCHDVHGATLSVFKDRRLERRCLSCHPKQAGPFVYEHEADRIEGCQVCHRPHGSPNRRLLTVWPLNNLCIQCHPNTPGNHDQSSFSPFTDCIRCHTEIHGSDVSNRFFR